MEEILASLLANPVGALGVLGLGAVIGAVYTARATDRRERRAWQRDQQVKAYAAFQEALWSSYFRVTGGVARRSVQQTIEDGLEELNDANADDIDAIMRATVDVAAYGDKHVARYASGLAAAWEQWLYEATPLSGTQCWPSTWQKKRATDDASSAIILFSYHVRRSVGRVNPRLWWQLISKRRPNYRPDHPLATITDSLDARQCLIDWKVRAFNAEIPTLEVGYGTAEMPWTSLDVEHRNFFTPLAAVAYKRKNSPWSLAIEGRLPKSTIGQLELDAVRLITGNNGAWPMKLRASNWVAGEQEGDRVFLWMMEDLAQRGLEVEVFDAPGSHESVGDSDGILPFFVASTPAEAAEWINQFAEGPNNRE